MGYETRQLGSGERATPARAFGLSASASGDGRGLANAYVATPLVNQRQSNVLQRIAAAGTGRFAILIDHPAAVLRTAVILRSPLAAEFLVNGKALRVAEVYFAVVTDIRGHEALSLGQTAGRQRFEICGYKGVLSPSKTSVFAERAPSKITQERLCQSSRTCRTHTWIR